jgi:hypothetical protein
MFFVGLLVLLVLVNSAPDQLVSVPLMPMYHSSALCLFGSAKFSKQSKWYVSWALVVRVSPRRTTTKSRGIHTAYFHDRRYFPNQLYGVGPVHNTIYICSPRYEWVSSASCAQWNKQLWIQELWSKDVWCAFYDPWCGLFSGLESANCCHEGTSTVPLMTV